MKYKKLNDMINNNNEKKLKIMKTINIIIQIKIQIIIKMKI